MSKTQFTWLRQNIDIKFLLEPNDLGPILPATQDCPELVDDWRSCFSHVVISFFNCQLQKDWDSLYYVWKMNLLLYLKFLLAHLINIHGCISWQAVLSSTWQQVLTQRGRQAKVCDNRSSQPCGGRWVFCRNMSFSSVGVVSSSLVCKYFA